MHPRRVVSWVGRRANVIITGLLLLSLGLAIVAISGWVKADAAQRKINLIEFQRQQEAIGKRVADVATCFNRARSRPQLVIVLRGIAAQLPDGDSRRAAQQVVMDYEKQTPGRADCIALAKKLDVDWKPYVEEPEANGIGRVPNS